MHEKDVQAAIFLFGPLENFMCLRFSATLITGTVLAVSSLAYAKTQPQPTPATAKIPIASSEESGLAQVQAIFSYCESIDPHSAGKYERVRKVVFSGQAAGKGENNTTAAYLAERGVIEAQLLKVPVSAGISSCRTVIAGLER